MTDITRATGIAKATFFHHFKNKEELLTSVIEKFFFTALDQINADFYSLQGDTKQKLHFLFQAMTESEIKFRKMVSLEELEFKSFFFLMMEGMKKIPWFKEYYQKYHRKRNQLIHSLLSEGKKNDEIALHIDEDRFTRFIDVTFNGILISNIMYDRDEHQKNLDICFQMLWEQIRKHD